MHKICYLNVSKPNAGLTNQLYIIAGFLCEAIKNNKQVVIANNFQKEIFSNQFCPISEVIDIFNTNIFLQKYNVTLIDNNYLNFEITKVLFGLDDKTVDITYEINQSCVFFDLLFINKEFNLINLKGDPVPMKKKKIYITYKLSNYTFYCEFNEECGFPTTNIVLNFKNRIFEPPLKWRTEENKLLFNEIIDNIKFNPNLYANAQKFVEPLKSSKINVIHIKNENDCIKHYSHSIYHCNENIFKDILDKKYIYLINKYIRKEDINIILTYSSHDNIVINYLKNNNYNITFIDKQPNIGRELNAAIDMMIGESCNNIFLGPCYGSTFSELLEIRMKNNKKIIKFDLDHIDRMEEIVNK